MGRRPVDIKRIFATPEHPAIASIALLLLRVTAGAAFVLHGWGKIKDPFNWMGPDAFAPGPFQALAALAEFGGGVAWVLGLLTPLASLGIACTMAVAVYFHAILRGDPFVSMTGELAFEPAAVYFFMALLFLVLGPGRFSADRALFGRR
jgi:putative oxidoreductase